VGREEWRDFRVVWRIQHGLPRTPSPSPPERTPSQSQGRPVAGLPALRSLEVLQLDACGLRSIGDLVLGSLPALRRLDLAANELTKARAREGRVMRGRVNEKWEGGGEEKEAR